MMRRALAIAAALLAVRGGFAAPEMLAPPRFGDPTRMYSFDRSGVMDILTAFFDDSQASNFTAVCWLKWDPNGNARFNPPFVNALVSTDSARATAEGGPELPNLCKARFDVPLRLVNGTWSETCLPVGYECPATMGKWQYGCYSVNVLTDTALTLTVAGAEKSVAASGEMQEFNILGETSSRDVAISAASTNAQIRFGIAENPLRQFIGAQFDNMESSGSTLYSDELGGLSSNEWRMVCVRGRIADGSCTVSICGYNATGKLASECTVTQAMFRPRSTFAKDARLRICVAAPGGIGYGTENPDIFSAYGFRCYRGWLSDVDVERMRDLDAAEMTRRGMQ